MDELAVLHTTTEGTLAAMQTGARLAKGLGIRIRVFAFQAVPYPLSLSHPDVAPEFNIRRILQAIERPPLPRFCLNNTLCRDVRRALLTVIPSERLVLIGGRQSLFPSREQRLARFLESHGRDVLFIATNIATNLRSSPEWLLERQRLEKE